MRETYRASLAVAYVPKALKETTDRIVLANYKPNRKYPADITIVIETSVYFVAWTSNKIFHYLFGSLITYIVPFSKIQCAIATRLPAN